MMAEHGGPATMTDYIRHHLHHLEMPVGEGRFWVLHLDSIFFKLLCAAIFLYLFLRVARRAPQVVVKVVVTPASTDEELEELAARIAGVDPALPLVLQPVTPFGPVKERPSPERLLALVARLSRSLEDVRLVPQTHKLLAVP